MNMVPFNPAQAPAFIANVNLSPDQIKAMNAAAAVGTGGTAINKLSLKQSRFRLNVGGQETAVLPVNDLDLVIVRVNEAVTKTWFEKDWNPNDEPTSPECSSDDGIRPRADSLKPQSDACANCPQNQWGSKINRVTLGKIKACTDTKRMAVMAPDRQGRFAYDGDLYQLQIPPASLKDFGGFVRGLSAGSVPAGYNMVVANIAFDTTVSYPKLVFRPVRWLEADEWASVSNRYDAEEAKVTAGLADSAVMRVAVGGPAQPALTHQQPQVQQQQVQQPQVQQQQVQQPQVQQDQGGWGQQQVQPQVQQVQQPQVQQPQVQQDQGGWGQPQQVQQQVQHVEQPQAQQQVQPQVQQVQQPQVQQDQGGWGQQVQQPQAQQQVQQQVQQPQAQQQVQQQVQQPAQNAPLRQRGKPSAGKARRNAAEIEEDRLLDEADAARGAQVQQVQQQVQQPQVQQQPQAQGGWGEQQPQQVQQVQQPQAFAQPASPQEPWAGAGQVAQPTGAPNQPNVMPAGVAGAFANWDD